MTHESDDEDRQPEQARGVVGEQIGDGDAARRQHDDAEPAVDGEGRALRDVDADPLVTDGSLGRGWGRDGAHDAS